jgi:hypothetical protein
MTQEECDHHHYQILVVFLENLVAPGRDASTGPLSFFDVMRLQRASKLCHGFVKDHAMRHWHEHYASRPFFKDGRTLTTRYHSKGSRNCVVCGEKTSMEDVFSGTRMCFTCQDLHVRKVSHTECKKTYRLTDSDLTRLDHHLTRHKTYRNMLRFYRRADAMALAHLKHGGLAFLTDPKPARNKSLTNRVLQLNTALQKLHPGAADLQDRLRDLQMSRDFLGNGEGGIRRLVENLKKYAPFVAFATQELPHALPETTYMQEFSSFCRRPEETKACLVHMSNQLFHEQERRAALTDALAQHGLALRSDSRLCDQFIQGQGDQDLGRVVTTMRQMDFLFRHTQYARIADRMMQDAYEDARESVRYAYGYVHDHDAYCELLDEYMDDKETIRERAKVQAMRRYRGPVPEYMRAL